MLLRTRRTPSGFIEPCLPSSAERPPSGPGWIHEIKHDGYRLMARRDPIGIRLLTRNGYDWAPRYPLIIEAVDRLKARSFLIDGEAVACGDDGLPAFDRLRYRRTDGAVFLFAFDLLEVDGRDLRREPLETRKATLASVLRKARPGVQLNEHLEHEDGAVVFRHALGRAGSAAHSAKEPSKTGTSRRPRSSRAMHTTLADTPLPHEEMKDTSASSGSIPPAAAAARS